MEFSDSKGRRDPDWLTLGQAAHFLGVAQSTLRTWADASRVPAFYTPGGHRRFRRADLESFLARSGPGRADSGPVVLVVDDDDRVRELVASALELEGYTVVAADGADAGLAAIEEQKPDLVLLDVLMPHVDGWEMLRRIQDRHGAGAIPVVMFSGATDEELRGEAASRGASGFIGKPFDLDQLVAQAKAVAPV